MRGRAIVLARQNFGEADQYIQFFTQDWGMVTALARSARKSKRRYVGGLDLFCHDEIFIRGNPKEHPYLIELTVLNSFSGLRENIEKILAAGRVTQWVRQLANISVPSPLIYQLLGQTLSLIEKEKEDNRLLWIELVYRVKFLTQLGLKPRLNGCIKCGSATDERAYFDMAGGILCAICLGNSSASEEFFLTKEERDFLQSIDVLPLSQLNLGKGDPQKARFLNHLIARFCEYHTHVRLIQD